MNLGGLPIRSFYWTQWNFLSKKIKRQPRRRWSWSHRLWSSDFSAEFRIHRLLTPTTGNHSSASPKPTVGIIATEVHPQMSKASDGHPVARGSQIFSALDGRCGVPPTYVHAQSFSTDPGNWQFRVTCFKRWPSEREDGPCRVLWCAFRCSMWAMVITLLTKIKLTSKALVLLFTIAASTGWRDVLVYIYIYI